MAMISTSPDRSSALDEGRSTFALPGHLEEGEEVAFALGVLECEPEEAVEGRLSTLALSCGNQSQHAGGGFSVRHSLISFSSVLMMGMGSAVSTITGACWVAVSACDSLDDSGSLDAAGFLSFLSFFSFFAALHSQARGPGSGSPAWDRNLTMASFLSSPS